MNPIFSIHATLLTAVIILVRSDLLRRFIALLWKAPVMLNHEFEDWLMSLPTIGFPLHKLWTCSLCQAFHCAWLSSLLAFAGGVDPAKAVLAIGPSFLIGYTILTLTGGSRQIPRQNAEVEFEEPELKTEEWPIPKKNYAERLISKTTVNPNGGMQVLVSGMDGMAREVTEFVSSGDSAGCDFPRCAELHAYFLSEMKVLEDDPLCPRCEIGNLRKRVYDAAIALKGG